MSGAAGGVIREAGRRPSLLQVLCRGLVVAAFSTVVLGFLALVLPGLEIDHLQDALLAAIVVGVLNAVVWPALAVVVVPLSVLTLGIGSIVLDAVVVYVVFDWLPGVSISGVGTAIVVVIGLALVTTLVSTALALDDDAWEDEQAARRTRRKAGEAAATDVPGFVFVQLDGVSRQVFERARVSGNVPTLDRWLRDGSHQLVGWETGWSSQTGVSQCGILHGSVVDMPAFRWVDKATGEVIVSNRPKSAAAIERTHSDGHGLLAHHGSSYGNLFSGDAARAVLTMSGAGRRKEGRIGAGYVGYFTRPQQATRTFVGVVIEVARERRAARIQRRRQVAPSVHRGWTYALLRAFTTIVSRDVCVQGVLNDVAEGRAAIYVDLLGYDEVAHHSGIERPDALAVLGDLDRQVERIARAVRWAPRPYHVVVLSDHGQTQGPTFEQRTGETLAALVGRLCGGAASGDTDAERGNTESTAWLRTARGKDEEEEAAAAEPTVLGSGSLGLVFLPGGEPRRLTRAEIDQRYPALIPGLVANPEIGFVLVVGRAGLARDRCVRRPSARHRRRGGRRPARAVRWPGGRAGGPGRRLPDRRRPHGQQPVPPGARRSRCVRGPGGVPRRPRRPPDPALPAVPRRAVDADRADLHVGRRAPGPEDVDGRGRATDRAIVAGRGAGAMIPW